MEFPKITSAYLNVTDECNLRCKYCFVNKQPNYIALQTAKDVVDFLAANAQGTDRIPSINFFGGEPTLMWDSIIVPLVKYTRERYWEFDFSMTSNGVLLTEDKLKFLKENNMGLLLSIDGDKETQDINRPLKNGDGSFDVVMANVPKILEYNPYIIFRATVTPETVNKLYHNMLFAEQIGFKNYFVVPDTLDTWSDEDRRILYKQMNLFADHCIDSMRQGILPINFVELNKRFRKIIKRNNAIINDEKIIVKSCDKCGLGVYHMAAIGYDGSIYSCQELCTNDGINSPFYIGSIYDGVDDSKRLSLCNLFDNNFIVGNSCDSCILNRICDGGCVAHNYFTNGNIYIANDVLCEWERILFNTAVKIMTTLGQEENKLFKTVWEMSMNGRHYRTTS